MEADGERGGKGGRKREMKGDRKKRNKGKGKIYNSKL